MSRRLRLTVAYDGTGFHGWQRQPGAQTIQGLLMASAARLLGEPVIVAGASRTDAGVHALRQVASLDTTSAMPAMALRRGWNALLPAAVRVLDVAETAPDFDPRRHARGKRYAYLIDRGAEADPFLRRFAWHAPQARDTAAMALALRAVVGKRDFSAFCAAPGRDRSPICTVASARLAVRRQRLAVLVSGDSFLHHMVRNVVGSLVEVGRGARRAEWMATVLDSRDRRQAGPTAPARGLVLVRVLYPGPP